MTAELPVVWFRSREGGMGRLTWSINVSVDGYADHTVGTGVDDDLFGFFSGLLEDMDLVVFGRVTYQLMEAAWPNARNDPSSTKRALDFADKFSAIPKIVFSRTLDSAHWNNTRLMREDMVREMTRLREQRGKNILVDGISIAKELMRRGMIDEYWFVVHPIVSGKGKRLFDTTEKTTTLRLLDTKVFKSGVVALHYENNGDEA
jgi:dihydrofolate reductase